MQKLAKVFSIVLLIFCIYNTASAVSMVEIFPDIASNGVVTSNGTIPTSGCTTAGGAPGSQEHFIKGTYPTIGTSVSGGGTANDCTLVININLESVFTGLGDGDYWVAYGADVSTSSMTDWSYYFRATRSGGSWNAFGGVGVFPETPEGTVTSPVEFSGTYTNDGNYNRLVIFLCEVDNCTSSTTYPFFLDIGFTEATEEPYSIIEPLALGVYQSFGILLNTTNFNQSDGSAWVEFTIEEDRCEALDIGCYFQRVITFLFYPSDGSLNVFKNLYQQIQTKPPFGYIFAILDEFENFDASDDSLYEIPTAEFLQEFIFDDVRIAFVWLLWFVFAAGLLKRFKLIEL